MSDRGEDLSALVFEARCVALTQAVAFAVQHPGTGARGVERLADRFLGYLLSRTAVLRVRVSPVTFTVADPGSYHPTIYTDLGGGQVAVTMQDNEYVTLSVDPTDAQGNPTADTGLTWTADTPSMVTLTPSADGTQCNVGAAQSGGALGTVNITVTDAAGIASPADPITITSGPASTLGIAAGTPVAIPAGGVPVPPGAGG